MLRNVSKTLRIALTASIVFKSSASLTFVKPKMVLPFAITSKPRFLFASETVNLPHLADSITEGKVLEIKKHVGDYVELDQLISVIQTDKISIQIKAPKAGVLTKIHVNTGDVLVVGKPFFDIDPAGAKPVSQQKPAETPKPAVQPAVETAKPVQTSSTSTQSSQPAKQQKKQVKKQKQQAPKPQQPNIFTQSSGKFERKQTRQPLSRLRLKVGQRLKESQNTYALLTTFQEVDMSGVMEVRKALGEEFLQKYGIKLGFMSFFVKASVGALQDNPIVNAVIDGTDILHRNYIDISVAVATPNGLMVPVLRNCQSLKMHQIEIQLANLAKKGKQGKINLQDIVGGSFTISNGGTFGSLMGTPIVNPPQSAILGMHAVINRPVVRGDQIVARPMMYLALTYDHRLLDGKDAVTFLKKIQNQVEDPRRLLLEI